MNKQLTGFKGLLYIGAGECVADYFRRDSWR